MENANIGIKYLFHSGFLVETASSLLVFDFYRGDFEIKDKKTYVFSSHIHYDHYNPEIYKWQKKDPSIRYILSSDIFGDTSIPMEINHVTFMSPCQEKKIDDIKVKAYGSTDEGVSYLVECDGKNIFHAGDLNWWCWPDDTPEEIEEAEKGFKEEIAKIKAERIDIAFFPVDPRLKHNYSIGAEFFIKEINPRYFIPMHFGQGYKAVRRFKDKIDTSLTQVIEFTQKGQEIILSY